MRRLEGGRGMHLQQLRNGAVASLDESAQEVKRRRLCAAEDGGEGQCVSLSRGGRWILSKW